MPTNISVRLDDDSIKTLDQLTTAVRAYYEREAVNMPALAQLAKDTTKSSALRDLLLAWKHGNADSLFDRELTAPVA